MAEGTIAVVRGKRIITTDGLALRAQAAAAARVVLDVGAGDGRWIYRLARARRDWVCVALDADAAGMREASFRAGRKSSRRGAANAWFVRASAEALPPVLGGLAEEIHVRLPWGSLLRAVLAPEPTILEGIARLGRPGAALRVRVNCSILDDPAVGSRLGLRWPGHEIDRRALIRAYAAAGILLERVAVERDDTATSWGRRLARGGAPLVLALDGTVQGPPAEPQAGWHSADGERFLPAGRFGGTDNLFEV